MSLPPSSSRSAREPDYLNSGPLIALGILGRLESSFGGERDAAALAAVRFLRERKLRWGDVVLPNLGSARTEVDSSDLATCIRNLDQLTAWERQFVVSLRSFPRISAKQLAVLRDIARKARAAAA